MLNLAMLAAIIVPSSPKTYFVCGLNEQQLVVKTVPAVRHLQDSGRTTNVGLTENGTVVAGRVNEVSFVAVF